MQKVIVLLISFLALLLPWHGAISVFLPEGFRYWKEIVLVGLFLVLVLSYSPGIVYKPSLICLLIKRIKKGIHQSGILLKNGLSWSIFKKSIIWAIGFLIWLDILLFIDQNYYSILSARYLGLGFMVFIAIFLAVQNLGNKFKSIFEQFSNIFVGSALLSMVFGTWAKFLGGGEFLQNFYSTTISSWVPGQTIPLHHQTSEGIVRMQGGASGPVEFGHLLFVAVFLVLSPKFKVQRLKAIDYGVLVLLFFGLWQSGSRAALGGGVLLLGFYLLSKVKCRMSNKGIKYSTIDYKLWADSILKYSKFLLITICSIVTLKIVLLAVIPKNSSENTIDSKRWTIDLSLRLSDVDHFTRPIQAIKDGFKNPIMGDLGSYGPAARARNLAQNNDDRAPIAENIFADYFVQTGLIGLILALGFWVSLFLSVRGFAKVFVGVSFLLVNMATLFDMTPLSLIFFTVFAFLAQKNIKN